MDNPHVFLLNLCRLHPLLPTNDHPDLSLIPPHNVSRHGIQLKSWQDKESHWLSNLVLHSTEGKHQVSVEFCHAIGKSPKIPCGAVDQPEFEVKGSKFMFDDKVFKGKQAKSDIIDILKKSCPGCTLYLQDDGKSSKNSFQLRCNHYPQQSKESKEKIFNSRRVFKR